MRKFLSLFLASIALTCCDLLDFSSSEGRRRQSEEKQSERHPAADTSIFFTAVSFPDDYHWQRDTAAGNVNCSIRLYKNMELQYEIQAGPGTSISQDADRHWLWKGHLYAAYPTPGQTIISKDGKEMFRYEERENIRGFLVQEANVYTLGQSQEEIFLRRNGTILFSADSAFICGGLYDTACRSGALYKDGEHLCFTYYKNSGGNLYWYTVSDGVTKEIVLPPGVSKVFDIRQIEGETWMVAAGAGNYSLSLYKNSEYLRTLIRDVRIRLNYCRIFYSQGQIFIKTEGQRSGSDYKELFRSDGSLVCPGSASRVLDYCLDGHNWAYTAFDDRRSELSNIVVNGLAFACPPKSFLVSNYGLAIVDNTAFLALSPTQKGGQPVLWKGGDPKKLGSGSMEEIDINGYLGCVEIVY